VNVGEGVWIQKDPGTKSRVTRLLLLELDAAAFSRGCSDHAKFGGARGPKQMSSQFQPTADISLKTTTLGQWVVTEHS
jgi:hypothetical protein